MSALEPGPASSRSPDARLARLHLRGGMLSLARAELEQMAGAGTLDREALMDLAEARWRGGDLDGAAVAAEAHLDHGGLEPMAHLILAEAFDRRGSLIDARAESGPLVEQLGPAIARLFAGEPRSSAWPGRDELPMFDDASQPGHYGLLAGGSDLADGRAAAWKLAPPPEPVRVERRRQPRTASGTSPQSAASPAPAAPPGIRPVEAATPLRELLDAGLAAGLELASVERQVERGEWIGVAERLALLLRMDRALAPVILTLADKVVQGVPEDDLSLVALQTLRGDIYRGLGREAEATAAYQSALRAMASHAHTEEST
jgi:hypothetical protein